MNKNTTYTALAFILMVTATVLMQPTKADAATMYFESGLSTTSVGDVVIIRSVLDTEDKNVNAIEGTINIRGIENAVLREIRTDGSDFTLWPEKPSFVQKNNSINFSGGVPGGRSGDSLRIFDMIFEIKNTNAFSIVGAVVNTYLADGNGTLEKVTVEPASLLSMKKIGYIPYDEPRVLTDRDNNPPAEFEIEIGRSDDAYDSKIFISFNVIDSESGIEYTEIKEGDREFVRSGSPYVLQGQDPSERIVVRAVDRAGNAREIVLNDGPGVVEIITFVFVALIVIIILLSLIWKLIKR